MLSSAVLAFAVAALFAGLLVAAVTIALASLDRIGVAKGLAAIDRVYTAGTAGPGEEAFGDRVVKPTAAWLATLGRAATPAGAVARLRRWLDQAGNPPAWPVDRLFEAKGLGLFAGLVAGLMLGALGAGVPGAFAGALAGAALGFYTPDLAVYEVADKRQGAMRRSLPDVLDMLTVSVEAGLGLDAALVQVTRYGRGPLAAEFARTLQEIQIGMTRSQALRGLGERTRLVELKTFCAVVVQATELGIPIANVLREQAREMRLRRRQRAEELAQKVPVKILFPLVFCLFPALFIVVLGPGVINIMHSGLFH